MNRINRIPWELGKFLGGNEYKILDYLLYRNNNSHGWKFWTSGISKETGASLDTVFRTLQKFIKHGFITQDASHHYHFDYNKCMTWVNCLLSENENRLLSETERTVSENESTQKKVQNTIQNIECTDYLLSENETKQNGTAPLTLKNVKSEYVPRRAPGESELSYKNRIGLAKKLDQLTTDRMKGGQQ